MCFQKRVRARPIANAIINVAQLPLSCLHEMATLNISVLHGYRNPPVINLTFIFIILTSIIVGKLWENLVSVPDSHRSFTSPVFSYLRMSSIIKSTHQVLPSSGYFWSQRSPRFSIFEQYLNENLSAPRASVRSAAIANFKRRKYGDRSKRYEIHAKFL